MGTREKINDFISNYYAFCDIPYNERMNGFANNTFASYTQNADQANQGRSHTASHNREVFNNDYTNKCMALYNISGGAVLKVKNDTYISDEIINFHKNLTPTSEVKNTVLTSDFSELDAGLLQLNVFGQRYLGSYSGMEFFINTFHLRENDQGLIIEFEKYWVLPYTREVIRI